MKHQNIAHWFYSPLVLLVISLTTQAQLTTVTELTTELVTLMERNISLTQAEDIDGVMATIHTKSPVRAVQLNSLQQIMPTYDLKFELLDFHYVGEEETFAYARMELKTSKVAGPIFRDNTINALVAFKKEGASWKIWNQVTLDVEFEDENDSTSDSKD